MKKIWKPTESMHNIRKLFHLSLSWFFYWNYRADALNANAVT